MTQYMSERDRKVTTLPLKDDLEQTNSNELNKIPKSGKGCSKSTSKMPIKQIEGLTNNNIKKFLS